MFCKKNKLAAMVGVALVLYLTNCGTAFGHHGRKCSNAQKIANAMQITQPDHREILYIRARTFFINDDLDEASEIINRQIDLYPDDEKSLALRTMIQRAVDEKSNKIHRNTRLHMLDDVDATWKMEDPSGEDVGERRTTEVTNQTETKLAKIIIPQVRFMNLPISQVVETITELSIKYDITTDDPHEKGVNIVLLRSAAESEPKITLNLRNISLERLLFYVSQAANYSCNHTHDAIVIGDAKVMREQLETKFFPISRAAVIRLTGHQDWDSDGTHESKTSISEEESTIKNFLVRAGVEFNTASGSNMAFDGSQLIVTNTLKNLQRIERILQKYNQTQQVEIEAKFLEVTQGALDELAFRWNVVNRFKSNRSQVNTGTLQGVTPAIDNLRTLAQAFAPSNSSRGDGQIVRDNNSEPIPINNQPPNLPGQINIGTASVPFGSFLGLVDRAQVNLMIRALEQKTDSDLMSAPKLTVLSGKTASIVVAQELRYPQSYGETRSEVGTGSTIGNSTSAGVTITAGTPRDFATRNIGVEMRVTPTVESDSSISLRLEPKVTAFEGFMEYGGMNVAVTGGNTVYVPSGFYQPLFSTREIRTEVTVQNGWTVVMGGLTHEEVKEVHDKIPILGDIPLLGKMFRSKSETMKKRNLLIFVTARTVSPNGTRFQRKQSPSNLRSILSSQK
jgi:general secretion pathway protein D